MIGIEVDVIVCDYIVFFGYGDVFGYFLGYGIGLEIYEGFNLFFKSF